MSSNIPTKKKSMRQEVNEFASSFGLSPRETEVFDLLTNKIVHFKEIAQHLKLSPSTVNNHFKSIFEKTKTNSKSELLAAFLRHVLNQLNHCKALARKPQVLVIDDEPGICDIIVEELTQRGVKAYGMSDPAEALKALATMKLDVVISDLRMPNMDGIALLKEIRKTHHYFPSVMFVSGYTSRQTLDQVMDMGAVALLEKPIDMNKLFATVMEQYIEDVHDKSRILGVDERIPSVINGQLKLTIGGIGFGGAFIPLELADGNSVARQDLGSKIMEIGNLVSFWFHLDDDRGSEPIKATGEVVWRRDECRDGLQAGIGIKFVQLSEGDLDRVRDYARLNRILSFIPLGTSPSS